MKLHKLKLSKKPLVISTATFVAALGLLLSVFAETAGGANLQDANKDNHDATASYQAAHGVFSHVDIDNAGSTVTATTAALSSSSPTSTTTSSPIPPAANPTDGVTSPPTQTTPPTEPPTPACPRCGALPRADTETMHACPLIMCPMAE